jgi:hypothetical protein
LPYIGAILAFTQSTECHYSGFPILPALVRNGIGNERCDQLMAWLAHHIDDRLQRFIGSLLHAQSASIVIVISVKEQILAKLLYQQVIILDKELQIHLVDLVTFRLVLFKVKYICFAPSYLLNLFISLLVLNGECVPYFHSRDRDIFLILKGRKCHIQECI